MNAPRCSRRWIAPFAILLMAQSFVFGQGGLTIANPHWNITLTDYGYSDFLLDNTSGWVLEETGDLSTWRTSTRDITTANGQRSVTVDPSEGKVFFRLKHP